MTQKTKEFRLEDVMVGDEIILRSGMPFTMTDRFIPSINKYRITDFLRMFDDDLCYSGSHSVKFDIIKVTRNNIIKYERGIMSDKEVKGVAKLTEDRNIVSIIEIESNLFKFAFDHVDYKKKTVSLVMGGVFSRGALETIVEAINESLGEL